MDERTIRFFIVGAYGDPCQIINATSEQDAFKTITGYEWPEGGPSDEDWECTEVVLKPGAICDLSRFM